MYGLLNRVQHHWNNRISHYFSIFLSQAVLKQLFAPRRARSNEPLHAKKVPVDQKLSSKKTPKMRTKKHNKLSSPPLFTLSSLLIGAWVGGVTERRCLGCDRCRPDFVFWECQHQFQGGRGSVGGINLGNAISVLPSTFCFTSSRPPELSFESWEAHSSKN